MFIGWPSTSKFLYFFFFFLKIRSHSEICHLLSSNSHLKTSVRILVDKKESSTLVSGPQELKSSALLQLPVRVRLATWTWHVHPLCVYHRVTPRPPALRGRRDWSWQQQACDVLPPFLTTQKHFLPHLPNPSKEGLLVTLTVPVAWSHFLPFLLCFLCVALKLLPPKTSPSSQTDLFCFSTP